MSVSFFFVRFETTVPLENKAFFVLLVFARKGFLGEARGSGCAISDICSMATSS